MKTKLSISIIIALIVFSGVQDTKGQWNTNGNNIYNTNTGNVGIGNSSPSTLLYVGKNMTEPAITVRNLGGTGGATYSMVDDASGANWKFKATNSGGFKIRDHANSLDVFTIEANSAANAIYINAAGSVSLGTASPSSSAALDISNTTKGFLPPRMTSQQISMVSNPANGLVVFNTSDENLYVYSTVSAQWKRVPYGSETIAPDPCPSFSITHTAGNVAPVTKTVTYGTVISDLTGNNKCWITQNLGSDHQAISVSDNTEASAGWYWQFNRQQGYKHDGTTRTPNTTWITSIIENSNWLMVNDPCNLQLGAGWRLPTYTEWYSIAVTGGWNDWYGPWNSDLKMHAAGYLYYIDGSLNYRGSSGTYWSSSQADSSEGWGLSFSFVSGSCYLYGHSKTRGGSARCLRD